LANAVLRCSKSSYSAGIGTMNSLLVASVARVMFSQHTPRS
jgi:hypothetical protein